jgi:predicted MPP superfamily phosphohydrolase
MIIWIIAALLVLGSAFFYMGRRLIRPSGLTRRGKRIAWIALFAWCILLYASLFITRRFESLSGTLSWITYPSLGFLSSLFFLLLIRDFFWGVSRGMAKVGSLVRNGTSGRTDPPADDPPTDDPPADDPPVDASRRAHLLQLTNIGVVALTGAVTSYGIFEARRRPGIVEITVPIDRLPESFAGFRIVQITDVHAGLTVGREWIERVAEESAALKPDLIAFTGDIADGSVPYLRDAVAPFGELRAPYGKFFITGNHEYYSGVEQWVKEVDRLGYDVLLNEHRIIERDGSALVLAGVTDYSGGNFLPSHRSDPHAAFLDAPSDLVRIFLAHQPKTLRQTDGIDFDLMLSGHTHGGQFFPWNLATALDQPYLYGLHRPNGKWVYVSKGTGYWGPPVRLGARSEITVVTLASGEPV